ncbi:Putative penicillin-binding protein PbpX [Companilactobacillus paralimentarius]
MKNNLYLTIKEGIQTGFKVNIMKKMFLPILMLSSALLGIAPSTACVDSSVDTNYTDEFAQKANKILDQKGFSGSLLVVKNGKPIFETSRGYSNYGTSLYNNDETSYEIDSIQKNLTAAMVMKLVQENKLSLNDKLSQFYPEVPGSNNITLRQMMAMTSGLMLKGDVGPYRVMSDSEIINTDIKNTKYISLLHDKWNYQAINFNLLCGILEKVTGKTYQQLFTETYTNKLNLKHTIFAYDYSPDVVKAIGYNNPNPLSIKMDYQNIFYTKRYYEYDELGTGQVFMSASDLYKAEEYIMNGSMLTKKSRDELFVPGSISTYGGGMYHGKDDNYANGWGYGFQGVVHISDDGKTAVVALENYSRKAADVKPFVKQIYQMAND